MDERWADMYAVVSPYSIDNFNKTDYIEVVRFGVYVWYEGDFYWHEKTILKSNFDDVTIWLFPLIMNRLVELIDKDMDKVAKKNKL